MTTSWLPLFSLVGRSVGPISAAALMLPDHYYPVTLFVPIFAVCLVALTLVAVFWNNLASETWRSLLTEEETRDLLGRKAVALPHASDPDFYSRKYGKCRVLQHAGVSSAETHLWHCLCAYLGHRHAL
jgi:hypothetical protein